MRAGAQVPNDTRWSASAGDRNSTLGVSKNSARRIAPFLTACRAKTFAEIFARSFDFRSNFISESRFRSLVRGGLQRHLGCFPGVEFAHGRDIAFGRDAGRHRHTPAQGTIRQTRGGRRARTGCARGVDCGGCEAAHVPARRALLLSSCYFGKRADNRADMRGHNGDL
jgi:hypothetical protein